MPGCIQPEGARTGRSGRSHAPEDGLDGREQARARLDEAGEDELEAHSVGLRHQVQRLRLPAQARLGRPDADALDARVPDACGRRNEDDDDGERREGEALLSTSPRSEGRSFVLKFVCGFLCEFQIRRRFVICIEPRSPLLPFVSSTELIESITVSPERTSMSLQTRTKGNKKAWDPEKADRVRRGPPSARPRGRRRKVCRKSLTTSASRARRRAQSPVPEPPRARPPHELHGEVEADVPVLPHGSVSVAPAAAGRHLRASSEKVVCNAATSRRPPRPPTLPEDPAGRRPCRTPPRLCADVGGGLRVSPPAHPCRPRVART